MTDDIKVLQAALRLANRLWSTCDIAENGSCDYEIEERFNHCIECIIIKAEQKIGYLDKRRELLCSK